MACGLPKYMGQVVRQRASSPKLQVFNNALMGCHWVAQGVGLQAAQARPEVWGRLAESAVGIELLARHLTHRSRRPLIHYWNNGQKRSGLCAAQWPHPASAGSEKRTQPR